MHPRRGDSHSASGSLFAVLSGSWRTSLDATAPAIAFIGGWWISGWVGDSRSVPVGVVAAMIVAAVLAVDRLRLGARPTAVVFGLLAVTIAAIIALYTGAARDFFIPRLLVNAASAIAFLASIAARWPLLGVLVGAVLRQKRAWRADPDLLRAYTRASWPWVGVYLIRTAAFGLFWWADWPTALAIAQVALTWPLVVAGLAASTWIIARTLPAGHPGIRHPTPPSITPT